MVVDSSSTHVPARLDPVSTGAEEDPRHGKSGQVHRKIYSFSKPQVEGSAEPRIREDPQELADLQSIEMDHAELTGRPPQSQSRNLFFQKSLQSNSGNETSPVVSKHAVLASPPKKHRDQAAVGQETVTNIFRPERRGKEPLSQKLKPNVKKQPLQSKIQKSSKGISVRKISKPKMRKNNWERRKSIIQNNITKIAEFSPYLRSKSKRIRTKSKRRATGSQKSKRSNSQRPHQRRPKGRQAQSRNFTGQLRLKAEKNRSTDKQRKYQSRTAKNTYKSFYNHSGTDYNNASWHMRHSPGHFGTAEGQSLDQPLEEGARPDAAFYTLNPDVARGFERGKGPGRPVYKEPMNLNQTINITNSNFISGAQFGKKNTQKKTAKWSLDLQTGHMFPPHPEPKIISRKVDHEVTRIVQAPEEGALQDSQAPKSGRNTKENKS